MTPLQEILQRFRNTASTEREKGNAFERIVLFFLKNDPKYDFSEVWLWADWAKKEGRDARDTGIDLVAQERVSGNLWAVQCKFYADDRTIYKKDIDSFFTESGKTPFTHRLIVVTTSILSNHVHIAMQGQHIPCSTLTRADLEQSALEWTKYAPGAPVVLREKKKPRPDQNDAIREVIDKLKTADRGKLLMACGTGKTFTALKIAEQMAGKGGAVLFLVPSLSLLSQSLSEWTAESEIPLTSFAVCSDTTTGKKKNDDTAEIAPSDLAYPATTKADRLAERMLSRDLTRMTVVFSTYHSLQVLSEAQEKFAVNDFDLIICDEAHRTTGATLAGEDESNFVRVHDQGFIKGKKRLYMTATPRVFGDAIKSRAEEVDAVLCSMDDPKLFGETLFTLNFSTAVHLGILADYKVLVLAVDEEHVHRSVQKLLKDSSNELRLDDATKIVGCWKALSKLGLKEDIADDTSPMCRAVAFCRDIKSSTLVAEYFPRVVKEYLEEEGNKLEDPLQCEVRHVQGSFNSLEKEARLTWLKRSDSANNTCRILSNARCLTEGVDVPSLDAVLFMHPRKSQVDIVQAVGRVMRRSPGKQRGYIILPIGVPADVTPEQALADNERYRVVWQVLQALRSHDDKFGALINKIELGADTSSKMEIVHVTDNLRTGAKEPKDGEIGIGSGTHMKPDEKSETAVQMPLEMGALEKAIYAKLVKKCGNRYHWEEWAADIAKIAETHITRIQATLSDAGSKERKAFDEFLAEIRDDLNESITESEAIEMLAQHLITKPVFDALFEDYDFATHNPVSVAMQDILTVLHEQSLEKETGSLSQFYESVKFRATGINTAEGKQRIILELYDKFFKKAFPKMTDKLGIVYTPVEVVDFIIHSVNDVLQQEFGETLGSKGVHILDPFTGTGTFITRLLQSGLIKKEELPHKYRQEIHANEIVLLAYYIAAINIEAAYHSITGNKYEPFEGICLTDTFQLYEKEDLISHRLVDNSHRRTRQKKLDIRVVMGNPPYSSGQATGNDNNANIPYPALDESIRCSYAAHTDATLKNALYDSYIRAIRWATDRITDSGVIAYVSNAGWIDGSAMAGLRKCLRDDFTSIYVFHLRGNARTSGEIRRREKDNVFGQGTRTPIAISLFVKNPHSSEHGRIRFYDIGDYLARDEKLSKIKTLKSISDISKQSLWKEIIPDRYNDWIKQRADGFDELISIGDKKDDSSISIFANYSSGIKTNRDPWCYNASKRALAANMEMMIDFYNAETARYSEKIKQASSKPRPIDFVDTNPKNIKWTRELLNDLERGIRRSFQPACITNAVYRPFTKQWVYYNRHFNNCVYQMPRIFPDAKIANRVIVVTGVGGRGFSCLMTEALPDVQTMFNSQCFPLKLYECRDDATSARQVDAFSEPIQSEKFLVRDGISKEGLKHFSVVHPLLNLSKEDIFYYVYGLLHSEEYRARFADNLSKELPRVPCVKNAGDFKAFIVAGRELAQLHVDYENAKPYPVKFTAYNPWKEKYSNADVKVEKMTFGKDKDKSIIQYNHKITLSDIPLAAYDYVVNGKPAIEWVMERQIVKTDADSGIVNDANLYAIETAGDAAYPLKLLQRVITVSLETMKIVRELPKLEI